MISKTMMLTTRTQRSRGTMVTSGMALRKYDEECSPEEKYWAHRPCMIRMITDWECGQRRNNCALSCTNLLTHKKATKLSMQAFPEAGAAANAAAHTSRRTWTKSRQLMMNVLASHEGSSVDGHRCWTKQMMLKEGTSFARQRQIPRQKAKPKGNHLDLVFCAKAQTEPETVKRIPL